MLTLLFRDSMSHTIIFHTTFTLESQTEQPDLVSSLRFVSYNSIIMLPEMLHFTFILRLLLEFLWD